MISEKDLLNVRTALIVSLSVLVLVILWKRLRQYILTKDMPAPLHAELIQNVAGGSGGDTKTNM